MSPGHALWLVATGHALWLVATGHAFGNTGGPVCCGEECEVEGLTERRGRERERATSGHFYGTFRTLRGKPQ